jgi:hypothetical protein
MTSSSRNRAAAITALGLATILVTGPAPSAGRQAPPTPLELFQRMLPVIRHDRCSNCHGGLDPRSSDHEGQDEVLHGKPCKDCHKAAPEWGPPGSDHFFVGKTDEQLCTLFSHFASMQGPSTFISNHLVGDHLIQAAFLGRMGGARPLSMPADSPPITQAAFVNLGRNWLNQGQGACVVEGTITQEETVQADDIWTTEQTDWRVQQNGKRTVKITLNAGRFRADINVDGTIVLTQVMHSTNAQGVPCTVTSTSLTRYTGAAAGAATVSTQFIGQLFADTRPPQKDYRIDVTHPPETTRQTETNTASDLCGFGMGPGDNDAQTFDWPNGWTFSIEGHLDEPNLRSLVGACDKTVKSSDVQSLSFEQDNTFPCQRFRRVGNLSPPWIMHHGAAASNHDGSDVVFRVVTYWNIAYRP